MIHQMVIAAIGEDQPGLVDRLSGWILNNGCSIADSRMMVMGGEFAVLLLVTGDQNGLTKMEGQLNQVQKKLGMTLNIKRTEPKETADHLLSYAVEVATIDHPGIVHDVASFFSQRNINIQDLSTSSYAAAHSGTPMFSIHMSLYIPANSQTQELCKEFLDYCDQLNLDGVIKPLKG